MFEDSNSGLSDECIDGELQNPDEMGIKQFSNIMVASSLLLHDYVSVYFNKRPCMISGYLMKFEIREATDAVTPIRLLTAPPTCTRGTPCLDTLLLQNQKIIDIATTEPKVNNLLLPAECVMNEDREGMGAKHYMPYLQNEMQWIEKDSAEPKYYLPVIFITASPKETSLAQWENSNATIRKEYVASLILDW
ncbi:hypothetical protein M5K25_022543 [Dendrobium thyrsiflorum]|uniref:Uncharacterized protein n=1 Tax=Dendrobium thyrsiflorum TaxID=117978 RepID=A0ABD0U6A6_DENTH